MLSCLLLAFIALTANAESREVLHQSVLIQWDERSLRLSNDTATTTLYDLEETNNERGNIIEHRSGTVLSVVGPWLSYSTEWYSGGGAHPSYGSSWQVIDVVKGPAPIELNSLFPEAELLSALRQNPTIQQAIVGEPGPTLAELLASLDGGTCCLAANYTRRTNRWYYTT